MAGKHVALLRGINVGRAKRVAMADLRTLFEQLGCSDVRTLLNSGNVVFSALCDTADSIASRIETALAKELAVSSRVTVLSASELAAAVTDNPLLEVAHDPSRLLVAVLNNPQDRSKLEPLTEQDWAPEALAIGGRVAYLWCAGGILESRLAASVNRILGDTVTARNWATILKLNVLAADQAGVTSDEA